MIKYESQLLYKFRDLLLPWKGCKILRSFSRLNTNHFNKYLTYVTEYVLKNFTLFFCIYFSLLQNRNVIFIIFPDSGDLHVVIEENAIKTLANLCDGDARIALNGLQLAIQSQVAAVKQKPKKQDTKELNGSPSSQQNPSPNIDADPHGDDEELVYINVSHIKEGLQKTHLLYDRNGEEHYNIISALHKSIRGSDENAALYWLARMLVGGEDPLYVARRLVRFASEDVGK